VAKVSIIIPARSEGPVLQRTVADIYEKATGEIECIIGFDGPPYQNLEFQPTQSILIEPVQIGLKALINKLAQAATGKYILKTDAHCMFAPGFDETLLADMQPNWVVTPRFYVLNAARWEWQDERFWDFFHLVCPLTDRRGYRFKAGGHDMERTQARLNGSAIDETMQMHGSAWFVNRDFFLNDIGGFPTYDPFGHAQEPPYLGLKAWLGPWGGALMVNKKCWYAHWHQENRNRGYRMGKAQEKISYDIAANFWMRNTWPERAHDIEWLIDKFWPVPTWPDNWRMLQDEYELEHTWALPISTH